MDPGSIVALGAAGGTIIGVTLRSLVGRRGRAASATRDEAEAAEVLSATVVRLDALMQSQAEQIVVLGAEVRETRGRLALAEQRAAAAEVRAATSEAEVARLRSQVERLRAELAAREGGAK